MDITASSIQLLVGAVFLLLVACAVLSWLLYRFFSRFQLTSHKNIELQGQLSAKDAELTALRERFESEKSYYELTSSELEKRFKGIAEEVLGGNQQRFFAMAKEQFSKEAELHHSQFSLREKDFKALVDPLKGVLEQYQSQVQNLEKEHQKTFVSLHGEIKRIVESNVLLSQETRQLKDALKKPHVRGRWGEMQLKNCVELAGMSEYADVTFQDSVVDSDNDRLMIPDLTVRMPGGRCLIVDAKTPIDAFLASLEAKTELEREAELLRHSQQVREQVKNLATKKYQESFENSPDFVVMFLPNESFLYAALEKDARLVEFALERKVLIATPPTFIGLLKVIRFGWNEDKLAENAHHISEVGKELHKRLCDFVEAFTNVGKHLDKAKSEYDTGLKRLESRVITQAKRLEDLGAKSRKEIAAATEIS